MTSISVQDILFDDFSLLEKQIGRQTLTMTSVNTNCDCASSPIALNTNGNCASDACIISDRDILSHSSISDYVYLNSNQITSSIG